MKNINLNNPVYFYDDRNKADLILKKETILFSNNQVCLCIATSTNIDLPMTETILFSLESGEVLHKDFDSWRSTNDEEWIHKKEQSIKESYQRYLNSQKQTKFF